MRLFRWLALIACGVTLAHVPSTAAAACLSDQRVDVGSYHGDYLGRDFADYGALFTDAARPACAGAVHDALATKVRQQLDAQGFAAQDPETAQPRFLGGGNVYLVMATALELGAQGWLNDLHPLIQEVIGQYDFASKCSPPADTCMDDYATAAAAFAWIAAYQAKTGVSVNPGAASAAQQYIHYSFSTHSSICLHIPGRMTPCVSNPTLAEVDAGQALTFNHNSLENPNYGVGLLTSLSMAFLGLRVAGAEPTANLTTLDRAVLKAVVKQAQRRFDALSASAGCSAGSGSWKNADCYRYTSFANGAFDPAQNGDCRDPSIQESKPGGPYRYSPGMYPVKAFVEDVLGSGAFPAPGYQFDTFACRNAFQPTYDFFHEARRAVYETLAYTWPYELRANNRPLPINGLDTAAPLSWADSPAHLQSLTGTATLGGWTLDLLSDVTDIKFYIDGQQVFGFTYGLSRMDVCAYYNVQKADPACPVGWGGTLNTLPYANGQHTLLVIATDRHGNTSAYSRAFRIDNIKLNASYVPTRGAARRTFTSTSSDPASFAFYYDEAAGNFQQQPGFPCNTGQNNPTYLKVSFQMPTISACSFQGSWDVAPITCNADHVALVNSGGTFALNTDTWEIDPATCGPFSPLRSIVPLNSSAWFKVNVVIGGVTYTRTLNFVKRSS